MRGRSVSPYDIVLEKPLRSKRVEDFKTKVSFHSGEPLEGHPYCCHIHQNVTFML